MTFERVDQSGFFTANVSASATVHKDIEAELRTHDVFTEITGSISFIQSLVHAFDAREEFTTCIDISRTSAESPARNNQTFDQAVRIFQQKEVILVRTAFAFVSVHHDIHRLARVTRNEAPLHAGRESRTATSAETGALNAINHFELRHFEQRLGNGGIAAELLVSVDALSVLSKVSSANLHRILHR